VRSLPAGSSMTPSVPRWGADGPTDPDRAGQGRHEEGKRLDDQEAFAHLRRAARSSGRKLSEVAREVATDQPLPRGRTRPTPAQTEQPKSDTGDPQQRPRRPDPEPGSAAHHRCCSPWHSIFCRMRFDHPDDPYGKVEGSNPSSGSKPQVRDPFRHCRPRSGNRWSFRWVDDRAAGALAARHVGVPPASPPALSSGWRPRPTELRSTPSSNPTQATLQAPTRLNRIGDCRTGSLLPLRVSGFRGRTAPGPGRPGRCRCR
jgi:hypothetical protein